MELDIDATESWGVSVDGTGQLGTYLYTAPEIEQGWPKINEKVHLCWFNKLNLVAIVNTTYIFSAHFTFL